MPDNFRLLQKNTAKLANIHVFPFGLGSADMRADVYANEDRKNHGAFSIYARETDSGNLGNTNKLADQIKIKNAGETLKKLDISQVDILKIDTESAEYDIVSCLP
jgi:FkbM family methyltransferase